MKPLLYSFIILFLASCSSEQRFSCDGEGFIISGNKATLGIVDNLKLCRNQGTVNYYSMDCKSSFFIFDTVSHQLRESIDGKSTQCKKLN